MKKRLFSLLLVLCLIVSSCTACAKESEPLTLTIAYQGGISYAPIHVMAVKKLIESNYGGDITVNYVKLDSGAAINEGVIGGTIDIGCMGIAPAISGVVAGIPYKAIANLSSTYFGLMSNDSRITSLSDITVEDKIALVNTGSIQHIVLAMAADKYLGDAHALDNNLQPMSHAEGMSALESGTVTLHLTNTPFIFQEKDNAKYNEIEELNTVWPTTNTFICAMASTKLEKNSKLFNAIKKSLAEAMTFVNENTEETAQIEVDYLGLDIETVKANLSSDGVAFFDELRGVKTMADFMYKAGFITSELDFEKFKFSSVKGN